MRLVRLSRNHGTVVSFGLLLAAAGAAGWILLYVGVPLWLAVTVAVLSVAVAIVALGSLTSVRSLDLLGWSPAFVLLTWPPLWLVVVLIRGLVTGRSVGS